MAGYQLFMNEAREKNNRHYHAKRMSSRTIFYAKAWDKKILEKPYEQARKSCFFAARE